MGTKDKTCDVFLPESLSYTGATIFNLAVGLGKQNYYENCKTVERLDNANQDIKLLEEMNELCQAVLKRMVHKSIKYDMLSKEHREEVDAEIADVIITLLGFIHRNNVNPDNIVKHMSEKLIRFEKITHELKIEHGES